jgi:hypothetical protein
MTEPNMVQYLNKYVETKFGKKKKLKLTNG